MNRNYSDARYLIRLSSAVQRGDARVLEDAIRFLEADPLSFRTGYAKEHVWKYLVRRYTLDITTIERLYTIALHNLERPIRREFWSMCNAIARLANKAFWQRVLELTSSERIDVAKRAQYLYTYSQGLEAGERMHQYVSAAWRWRRG